MVTGWNLFISFINNRTLGATVGGGSGEVGHKTMHRPQTAQPLKTKVLNRSGMKLGYAACTPARFLATELERVEPNGDIPVLCRHSLRGSETARTPKT